MDACVSDHDMLCALLSPHCRRVVSQDPRQQNSIRSEEMLQDAIANLNFQKQTLMLPAEMDTGHLQ